MATRVVPEQGANVGNNANTGNGGNVGSNPDAFSYLSPKGSVSITEPANRNTANTGNTGNSGASTTLNSGID